MVFEALVRVFKVVALLGFALPWFAVSCSGQKLIEARGYELAIGAELKPQGVAGMAQQQAKQVQQLAGDSEGVDSEGNAPTGPGQSSDASKWMPGYAQYLAAGAAGLLVVGLIVGFFLKSGAFHIASAAIAAIAGGLSYAVFAFAENAFKSEIAKGVAAEGMGAGLSGDPNAMQLDQMSAMALGMFQFTAEPGLWVTLGGCVAAVIAAVVGLSLGARLSTADGANAPPAT